MSSAAGNSGAAGASSNRQRPVAAAAAATAAAQPPASGNRLTTTAAPSASAAHRDEYDSDGEWINLGLEHWQEVRRQWRARPANFQRAASGKKRSEEAFQNVLGDTGQPQPHEHIPLAELVAVLVEVWLTEGF